MSKEPNKDSKGKWAKGNIGKLSHNQSYTKTYATWCGMKYRCFNKNSDSYHKYGAKGIGVSKSWLKFENFFRDMGEIPKGMTIDRIDGSKGYSKSNCRIADYKTQARNKKRLKFITHNGQTKCFAEWCEFYEVPKGAVDYYHRDKKLSFDESIKIVLYRRQLLKQLGEK